MLKKLFTLFKLGRKLAKSDALKIASKFNKPPLGIKILFDILSFSFSSTKVKNLNIKFTSHGRQNHANLHWKNII